jgi:hypothetical protein
LPASPTNQTVNYLATNERIHPVHGRRQQFQIDRPDHDGDTNLTTTTATRARAKPAVTACARNDPIHPPGRPAIKIATAAQVRRARELRTAA